MVNIPITTILTGSIKTMFGFFLSLATFFHSTSTAPIRHPLISEAPPVHIAEIASSSPIIFPSTKIASTTATTTIATTTKVVPPPKKPVEKKKPVVIKIKMEEPRVENLITIPIHDKIDPQSLNARVRDALVNILCITESSGPLSPITGSGVVIDPRGVIITNAHIAQYYLLKNYNGPNSITCTIRTGSPATPQFKATPLYISPLWVKNNFDDIKRQEPRGTGEDDFALLLITETIDKTPLPNQFSYLKPKTSEQSISGTRVLVAGYGAGFLSGENIQRNLYGISAEATIIDELSYTGDTYDFLEVSGNAAAQRGSSGGTIADEAGNMIGLISTVTDGIQTDQRKLGAISLSHINRSILKQAGTNLESFLQSDLRAKSAQFNSLIAPSLTKILIDGISRNTEARY